MSHTRTNQLQELQNILGEICGSIMWVNDKEEKELVFDWGDKNIDTYIPQKQESYSILMRELEKKEKELNKLKSKVDQLLVNHHPASDKIEAYMDTLQTQWSWLLQITKCIDVHLKENAAYSQFFKEAGEMHQRLDKDKQSILKNYSCDKTTPLQNLTELLRNLEKERDRLMENKRQVQTLVNKSKNIVQLKPRNPEERSTGQPVMVRALCDFKQDQKVICKGDEAILNDNSQRSKWNVTGPGGLDMLIPSVCLIIPPPNKYCTELAKKNEDHYEAIMSIWSQMLINIKSLIAWQYCLSDINKIKSITMEMLVQMKPEEYKSIVRSLEQHYEEFLRLSGESSVFKDADKRKMEEDFNTAQKRIKNNQVQGNYTNQVQGNYTNQVQGNYTLLTQVVGGAGGAGVAGAGVAVTGAGGETLGASGKKVDNTTITSKSSSSTITSSSAPPSSSVSLNLLTLTQTLRRRLEAAEGGLSTHLHVPLRDNSVQDCTQRLQLLQGVHRDLGSIRDEYIRLRELVLKQQATASPEQANFLKMELDHINQKLGSLESFSSSYLERLKALQAFFQSLSRAEDIIKVHEARLTEKETSSLDPSELQDYAITLKNMKADLDQRKDVLKAMEAELKKAIEWNSQIDQNFHQCDVDLDKFSVEVKQMSLRWERILGQINSRMNDLRSHEDQLRQYQQSSSQVDQWINQTSQRLNKLQNQKLRTVQEVTDHLNQHKTLHTEIKGKKDRVDEVQKDAGTCSSSIKDYELQLASYSAGLETLLNIPIKRTMLQSPATVLNQEVSDLQTRYMELLTRSTDYNKFLSEMMKNMEELKMQNTRIELLEEELRRLKDDLQDGSQNSKSKEDILACYKLELSQAKEKLIIIESEKSDESRRYLLTKESLDGTQNKLKDLSDQVARLTMLIDEEKRKRRLAEERYGVQQQEYEDAVRKRQKELDELNWSRIDFEKTIKDKEREIEQLKRQLQDEASQRRAAESETSKVRNQFNQEMNSLKQTFQSEIQITKTTVLKASQEKEADTAELKLQLNRLSDEKRNLEEELKRLRLSFSQVEQDRKRAEQEAHQQKSSGTEESRRRKELEIQFQTITRQKTEIETRYRDDVAKANSGAQEKIRQISLLTQNLEEEARKRKALEMENQRLRQTEADLHAKHNSSLEVINKLKFSEQETNVVRIEIEKQRVTADQNATRLQGRITDLQGVMSRLEAELEKERKANQDELTRRKRIESELERLNNLCREYTSTINTLRVHKEEDSATGRRYEQDLRRLQEELERSRREHTSTSENFAKLTAELKALQQLLTQEQARVREVNLRNESLYKTIEEKSRALNEGTSEIEKLQKLTQNLTKERLRLEEELRALRQERDDLKSSKSSYDSEYAAQLSAIQQQLQSANKRSLELQANINELNKEREKYKAEINKIQKQYSESTLIIQESQTHYKEVLHERDNLLAKLKMLEMNKDKQQRSEEELNRIKLSLDSELRQKQRLQEEIDKLRKDFTYWKSQYELKEGQMRQWQSTQDQADRDRGSLQNEIARLAAELRSAEERYRIRLQNSETEMVELNRRKETLERELKKLQLRPSATVKQTQTDQEVVAVDSSQFSVQGIRNKVSLDELLQCNMINQTDVDKVKQGQLSVKDIETRLKRYLTGSNCIAGVYDEAHDRVLPFYQAMKEGLLRPGTTLELLEAQAASGFMIDPVNNNYMTVEDAWKRTLVGKEFKDKLLSAERAVTGYRDPGTGKLISLFQAIEKELIEKGHGIRLLEAQIASGGIIDPKESHRIDVEMAYKKGYFNRDMNDILTYEGDDTKGFFDPNTHENLTYLELQKRCIKDPNTGLTLLPIKDKTQSSQQSTQKNTLRKRRVVIVDPDTGKEMSVREAYHRELIDYDTFLNLSEQECEWEEITITDPSGKTRLVIVDRKTGTQFDVQASLDKGVISKSALDQYRAGTLSLTQFANLITSKADSSELSICTSVADDVTSCSSPTDVTPSSPTVRKRFASVSITLSPPADILDDQSPVAAIFDTETLEKITITEAQRRGIVDTITAQRLLEAQVCTGGVINPATGKRLSLQDAIHQSVIEEDMATKLKPAQKAFAGFEDIKTRRKLSAAEAIKEKWLPYEAGQRFLEFQYLTGGLMEPGSGKRVTIEEAIRRGWLDGKGAQKLQDTRNYIKSLTCPKTKLKISYKEAMDNCMVEENNGMKMLQATSMSTKGISSPYNVSSGPNSRTGSRAGSRSGSRRGSVDYSSTATYSYTSSSFSPY
ncbi:desmoplakin-A isoform X2 [Trichomycterus rosablanca]